MAEYMLVPSSRLIVPIDDPNPRLAAPLTDAALTPYSAIARSLDKLTPDSTALVLGVVGLGEGSLDVDRFALPVGTRVSRPYWGSINELSEVIGLAQQGKLELEFEKHSLDDALEVYEKLHAGKVKGRAVLVP